MELVRVYQRTIDHDRHKRMALIEVPEQPSIGLIRPRADLTSNAVVVDCAQHIFASSYICRLGFERQYYVLHNADPLMCIVTRDLVQDQVNGKVLLAVPYDCPPQPVTTCYIFPARVPVTWNGTPTVTCPVKLASGRYYCFADTPTCVRDQHDFEMLWIGLKLDAYAWRREKRVLWNCVFRLLNDDVILHIESFLRVGLSDGRYFMIKC